MEEAVILSGPWVGLGRQHSMEAKAATGGRLPIRRSIKEYSYPDRKSQRLHLGTGVTVFNVLCF